MSVVLLDGQVTNDSAAPFSLNAVPTTPSLVNDAYVLYVFWNGDLAATCAVTDAIGNVYRRLARREFGTMVMEAWFAPVTKATNKNSLIINALLAQTTVDGAVMGFCHWRGTDGPLTVVGLDTAATASPHGGSVTIVTEYGMGAFFGNSPTGGVGFLSAGGGFSEVDNAGSTTTHGVLLAKVASGGTYEAIMNRETPHDTIAMTVALQMQGGAPVPVMARRRSREVAW